jgi:hypothetical protein
LRQLRLSNALTRWLRRHNLNVGVQHLRMGAIGLFLVASVAAFAIVLLSPSAPNHSGTAQPPAQTQTQTQTSASPQRSSAAATQQPTWVVAQSSKSSDILAAARATTTYQNVLSSQTPLGNALRTGTLGTPVLVHAYRPAPGMLDTWVIPVQQGADAQVVALLDFAYDTGQQSLHATAFAGPFAQGDPAYGQPFPRLTVQDALSLAQSKRNVTPMAGMRPELVYFPIDLDKTTGPQATVHWTGGGDFADTAIWLVHGTDGKDYLVGNDSQLYTPDQLPLVPNAGP